MASDAAGSPIRRPRSRNQRLLFAATTLRAYWPAVVALRDAAGYLPEEQELRMTTVSLDVRYGADILRPDFAGRRPVRLGGLRAAA